MVGNELMRNLVRRLIRRTIRDQIFFKYVLTNSWFASEDNFEFIFEKGKNFIFAVKSNRLFTMSLEDKLNGRFEKVGVLGLKNKEFVRGYLRGQNKKVILICQVLINKDGSTWGLYVVSSNASLLGGHTFTLYQRRNVFIKVNFADVTELDKLKYMQCYVRKVLWILSSTFGKLSNR